MTTNAAHVNRLMTQPSLTKFALRAGALDHRAGHGLVDPATPSASGTACVGTSAWNIVVVRRYLQWVATHVADARITVYDDGEHVAPPHTELLGGGWRIDEAMLAARRAYLASCGAFRDVARLDASAARARVGPLFPTLPALEHLDWRHPPLAPFSYEALRTMTLDEVADQFGFPWDSNTGP